MMSSANKATYILGYSGLDGYLRFKNKNISGLSKNESLVSQGMDSAAALIKDGEIIAAVAEERFTGKKHTGVFPKNAIDACLEQGDISINDVSYIAHNFNYGRYHNLFRTNDYSENLFNEVLSDDNQIALFKTHYETDVKDRFIACDHHESHATYAFETSGFDVSLVIVSDGLGEFNSISVYSAQNNTGLKLLRSYGPKSSLGMLYSAVTDYLGFITNSDEYKIMGLAAYGNAEAYESIFDEIVLLKDKGEIEIANIIPDKIESPIERETYRYFKNYLSQKVFPERNPSEPIEQHHKDFAASLQAALNKAMLHLILYWQHQTKLENLCLSGGVALNCVTNAHIANQNIFKKIYVAPASADDGTSLGAALIVLRQTGGKLNEEQCKRMPFYGPSIVLDYSNPLIKEFNLSLIEVNDKELVSIVSSALAKAKIIAWAQDSMEFGPRALGHRSILADPRKIEMRERLNLVTKQREEFRPFAPIIKEEYLETYFGVIRGVTYKHMLVNAVVKERFRDNLQAITHVDGTARVQSVSKKDLPVLWKLLDEFEKRTNLPILLNTSFNLKSMPIVCTEEDALCAFVDSDINMLVINNTVITKPEL